MADDSNGLRRLEQNDNGSKRVAIPSDVKSTLPSEMDKDKARLKPVRVTLSPTGDCICIFEPKKFDKWATAFLESVFEGGYEPGNSNHMAVRTVLYERAPLITPDTNGRVNIPAGMCDEAGFGSEVKQPFVVGDHVEIWDPTRWKEFSSKIDIASLVANRSR